MGTLYNERPYADWLTAGYATSIYRDIQEIQKRNEIDFYEALEVYKVMLEVSKADRYDEIMAGIGEEMQRIAYSISELSGDAS